MRGFTLIELLIVVAVLSAITVALIPQISRFQKNQSLLDGAAQLQSAFRMAENNASSGVKCVAGGASRWYLKFNSNSSYAIGSICSRSTDTPITTQHNLPALVVVSNVKIQDSGGSDLCQSGANPPTDYMTEFSNIMSDATFSGPGCPSLSGARRMVVDLKYDNGSITEEAHVVVEKGGGIFIQ